MSGQKRSNGRTRRRAGAALALTEPAAAEEPVSESEEDAEPASEPAAAPEDDDGEEG